MLPDLGNLCLYLALILCVLVALAPILERFNFNIKYAAYKISWLLISVFCLISFLILIYSYIISDFSILNVVYNSHTDKPMIYKISGTWGNHEGSMLLWINAINAFSILFILINREQLFGKIALSIQSACNFFFIAFTTFISSPFLRIFPAPINGLGLNPILQDIGLAFHPPILYLGYVGFSIVYSATLAALILNKFDQNWIKVTKLCVLVSLIFLTAGIALGSWWAYRELGWGGFWFWDPVENASLMPWLVGIALLHSLTSYSKTGAFKNSVILLSILTFILTTLGMFLVRSGIVTSVHAFATDRSRGIYILLFLAVMILFATFVYISKTKTEMVQSGHKIGDYIVSIKLNNIILIVITFTVILGTVYPMILEVLTGSRISVGAPYFNRIVGPISLLLIGVCCIFYYLQSKSLSRYINLVIGLAVTILLIIRFEIYGKVSIVGIFLGFLLLIQNLTSLIRKRSSNFRGFYSMILAHSGIAIIMIAICINTEMSSEMHKPLKIGDKFKFLEYEIGLKDILYVKKDNYLTQIALLEIEKNNSVIKLKPEVRFFELQQQQVPETAIYKTFFYDLYTSINGIYSDNGILISVYFKPMMAWLWFGAILIVAALIYSALTIILRRIKLR